jgi:hypothetical protein
VGLLDSANGDRYAGDAAGVYIPETGDLRPATPPPDFDLDVALTLIGKFASLGPSRLLFSHYTGPRMPVQSWLSRRRRGPDHDHVDSAAHLRKPHDQENPAVTSRRRVPRPGRLRP